MRLLFLTLIAACAPRDQEPDATRYTRLVSMSSPSPADLAECEALDAPDLQGDCSLVVARQLAAGRGEPPETHCDTIRGEVWQAECYFMAAEDHNDDDNIEQAAAMCLKSALFDDHCSQHLWQRSLRVLTWKAGSGAFADRLPQARRLYRRWAPLLAAETDFPVRFWRRYYEGGFERSRALDLAACDAVSGEDRLRCRAAGTALFTRRIQEVLRLPRAAADLCASEPTAAALAAGGPPQFQGASDPDLDDAVAKLQQTYCADGVPLPGDLKPHDLPFDPAP